MTDGRFEDELDRARRNYSERDASGGLTSTLWAPTSPAAAYLWWQQQFAYLRLMQESGLTDMSSVKVADFGCGSGNFLLWLTRLGAPQTLMHGVDLSEDRIAVARTRLPLATFDIGSAHKTSLDSGSCGIVVQNTLLSSVLDAGLRRAIAQEMDRVLASGGFIMWCDIRPPSWPLRARAAVIRFAWLVLKGLWTQDASRLRSRPREYLHYLPLSEVRDLFPGYQVLREYACTPMDLVRVRGKWTNLWAAVLDTMPSLQSNLICILRKPEAVSRTS